MPPVPYAELLRQARRRTRRADEAEDLLQSVLVAALEAGRCNLTVAENRRWVEGALRRRSAFEARSAARRRRRETHYAEQIVEDGSQAAFPKRFVDGLPPGLRTTALLVLAGHTRAEIAWLLRLSDTALRQRFSEIRRRWRCANGGSLEGMPGLAGAFAFGRIRRSLFTLARVDGSFLASHDPDGHLFVIGTSRNRDPRQLGRAHIAKQE